MLPRHRALAVVLTIVLLLGVVTVMRSGAVVEAVGAAPSSSEVLAPTAAEAIPVVPEGLDAVRGYRSVRQQERAAEPVHISVPALDIDAALTVTGLNEDRTLEVPDFGDISWFSGGVTPGDPGPAAVLGHVDSRTGPDVFFRLRELEPGDEITVTDDEGAPRVFVVARVEQHAKDAFPTEAVWLPTPEPQLRLITCGGDFDRRQRSYRDNVIVFASLVP